ncbi:rhodanese-like domain-containing protein [Hymenobacter koreensis]|uniref:Rhodanese-like domain-containing protein n=1 Tax=Hymenobacter koreensis TaxID=1084523 RepID=A0ABP8JCV6_9BACT
MLDVRPADQRAEWAIPGSRHVPVYEQLKAGVAQVFEGMAIPQNQPVVTVCAAGRMSQRVAVQLQVLGYDVYSLTGGMGAWGGMWNTAELVLPAEQATVVQVRRTGKGCLSYLIGSRNEAVVVDASVDPAVYQELAARYGWRITAVLETHLHADHLSRARDLATQIGARLLLPANSPARFAFVPLAAEEPVPVGNTSLQVLATPGHTWDSVCFRLGNGALLTGDTLFLQGVGRPDLKADEAEAEAKARQLHASLQALLALSDTLWVLPAHTSEPVPFDGRVLAATLGEVRHHTSLLNLAPAAFVPALLSRVPPAPGNYHRISQLNAEAAPWPAEAEALEAGANRCAVR